MDDPTDTPPPPSYQISEEEFDQKTSQALQLASSTTYEVDEDGWPIYDAAAFEAATESHEHPPSSSSSAGFPSTVANRQVRQGRSSKKGKRSTYPTKTRTSEGHSQHEDEFTSEARSATPPPPFTATGPSLDGPPFEQVVTLSYDGPDSSEPQTPSPPPPPRARPMLQPVEPLRLRPNRTRNSSNPYPSHQQIPPRPNLPSSFARVEFNPQVAYSSYSGPGNRTSIQDGAFAFYNHAVASQLMASSTTTTGQTQSGHTERPYSSGYTPTPYWARQATSSVSLHEQYTPHMQPLHLGAPAVPPPPPLLQQSRPTSTGAGYTRPTLNITVRGPLPPASTQPRWARSETEIVQDIYGGPG